MDLKDLTRTSFYFTNSWARFMGAGYFALEQYMDEMNECAA